MPSLPQINLTTPVDLDIGVKKLGVFTDARLAVSGMGFGTMSDDVVRANTINERMKRSFSSMSDMEIGDLLKDINEYLAFTEYRIAEVQIEHDAVEEQLMLVESHIRISLKGHGEKMTVQEKEDITRTNERVVELQARKIFLAAQLELIEVIQKSYQRRWETVSRNITQRGQSNDRFRREENMSNMGPTPAA